METNIQSTALPEVSNCKCLSWPSQVWVSQLSHIRCFKGLHSFLPLQHLGSPLQFGIHEVVSLPSHLQPASPSCQSPGELLGASEHPLTPASSSSFHAFCQICGLSWPLFLAPLATLSCSGQPHLFDTSELDSLTCCLRRPHHSNQRDFLAFL